MVIAASFDYGADPGGCVLIDLDKIPSDKEGIAFKKCIQKALSSVEKACVIRYEIAQSDSVFSAHVDPPQMVEEVVDIYVE